MTSNTSNEPETLARVSGKMRRVMKHLRQSQLASVRAVDLEQPAMYTEEANYRGTPYQVPLFILRTRPCFWFRAGGCSVCNYHETSALNNEITRETLMAQIDHVVERVTGAELPYVLLTSSGSFLDDREIPEDLRLEALGRLAQGGLKALSFECRAEFLSDRNRLRRCVKAFAGGSLQVGIGLESIDPFVRNVILHKGLTAKSIDRAVQALRAEGVGYYFYVMVGKPFMAVSEDIADTIATINHAFELGGAMVVLEMINVQPHTLTKLLHDRGIYRPPSLWLGIEALRHLKTQRRHGVPIKGYEKAEPMPEVFPDTCDSCRDRVHSALREWNLRRNWRDLERATGMCPCRGEFENELAQEVPVEPLSERVEATLDRLIDELAIAEAGGG